MLIPDILNIAIRAPWMWAWMLDVHRDTKNLQPSFPGKKVLSMAARAVDSSSPAPVKKGLKRARPSRCSKEKAK